MGSLVNFWRAKPKQGVDLFTEPKNCRLASRKTFPCVMSDVGKFDCKVELTTNDILHLQCVCVGGWGEGEDCCRLHFRFPHARQNVHVNIAFMDSTVLGSTRKPMAGALSLNKNDHLEGLREHSYRKTNLHQLSNNLVTFPNTQQRAHKGEQLQKRNLHRLSNNPVTFHNTQQ